MISQNQETAIISSSNIQCVNLDNLSEVVTQQRFHVDKKIFLENLPKKENGMFYFVELLKHFKTSIIPNTSNNLNKKATLNKLIKLMLILKDYYKGHENHYCFELERLLDKDNLKHFTKESFHNFNYFHQFFGKHGNGWRNRTMQFTQYPQLTIEDILKFDGQKYNPNNLKTHCDLSKTDNLYSDNLIVNNIIADILNPKQDNCLDNNSLSSLKNDLSLNNSNEDDKNGKVVNFNNLQKTVKKHILSFSSQETSFIVGNNKTINQDQVLEHNQNIKKIVNLDCLQDFEHKYELKNDRENGFLFEKQFNFLLNNPKSLLGEEQAVIFNRVLNKTTKSVKSDKAVVLTPDHNIHKTDIVYKNKNKSYTRFSLKSKICEKGGLHLGVCSSLIFKKLINSLTQDKRLLSYLDKVLSFEQKFIDLPISSQERIMRFFKSKGLTFFKYAFLGHHQENIKWFVFQNNKHHQIYFHETKKMFEFFEEKLNEDGFKITVTQKNKDTFVLKFGDFFRMDFDKGKTIKFNLRNRKDFPLSMMLKIDLNNAFLNYVYGLSEN